MSSNIVLIKHRNGMFIIGKKEGSNELTIRDPYKYDLRSNSLFKLYPDLQVDYVSIPISAVDMLFEPPDRLVDLYLETLRQNFTNVVQEAETNTGQNEVVEPKEEQSSTVVPEHIDEQVKRVINQVKHLFKLEDTIDDKWLDAVKNVQMIVDFLKEHEGKNVYEVYTDPEDQNFKILRAFVEVEVNSRTVKQK